MPSFTAAPFIIGGILGLGVLGLLVAVLLRLVADWVVKIEIPFGKAFGLAIAMTLLNGVLGFIIGATFSGSHTAPWLPFAVSHIVGAPIASAMLSKGLAVRFAKGALVYGVSVLLSYGVIGVLGGACMLVTHWPKERLQRTAPSLGSRTVRQVWFVTVAVDRAFPAAVAELDRRPS